MIGHWVDPLCLASGQLGDGRVVFRPRLQLSLLWTPRTSNLIFPPLG